LNPLILSIKSNSLDDGPGIRSVVFFKGCPLDCIWCHNPEGKKRTTEISFEPNLCTGCDTCLETCTKNALSRQYRYFIDRAVCDLCFDCVETCPSGALERVGREIPVSEIVEKVLKDKPFFDASGGGATLSGGEPTLNMEFLANTAKALKEEGVHVLIETCGLFEYDEFIELVYPHTDLIYFDIKLLDSGEHKKYCGLPNDSILENFRKLQTKHLEGGTAVLPRIPLIPGITDTPENLHAIAAFFLEGRVKQTRLMANHPLWRSKNLKLGIEPLETGDDRLGEWMSEERVEECGKIFTEANISVE